MSADCPEIIWSYKSREWKGTMDWRSSLCMSAQIKHIINSMPAQYWASVSDVGQHWSANGYSMAVDIIRVVVTQLHWSETIGIVDPTHAPSWDWPPRCKNVLNNILESHIGLWIADTSLIRLLAAKVYYLPLMWVVHTILWLLGHDIQHRIILHKTSRRFVSKNWEISYYSLWIPYNIIALWYR